MGTAVAGGEEGGGEPGAVHVVGQSTGLAYEVADLRLEREDGGDARRLPRDATVLVTADVQAPDAVPQIFIGITRADRTPVYGVASDMDEARPEDLGAGRYRYRLRFHRLPLTAGTYLLRAHALDETGTRLYDTVELTFEVEGDDEDAGLIRLRGYGDA
jgi:lipopolysaccharide transport system ATP-binding protein